MWETFLKRQEALLKVENEGNEGDEENEENAGKQSAELKALKKELTTAGKALYRAVSKPLKKIKPADRADIVIFGRMAASDPTLTIVGAAMVNHAISTHRVVTEIDFFSALDENQPEAEFGAAITGHQEFNSAVYYRYIGVNVDLLRKNSGYNDEDLRVVIDTFIRATLEAIPTARKNSFNGDTPPSYCLGRVRRGHPISLANAFETPVSAKNGSGLIRPSIEALEAYRKRAQAWRRTDNLANDFAITISDVEPHYNPDITLDSFCEAILNKLQELQES
jgi:CRISPR system Cascade subunit CasC